MFFLATLTPVADLEIFIRGGGGGGGGIGVQAKLLYY